MGNSGSDTGTAAVPLKAFCVYAYAMLVAVFSVLHYFEKKPSRRK